MNLPSPTDTHTPAQPARAGAARGTALDRVAASSVGLVAAVTTLHGEPLTATDPRLSHPVFSGHRGTADTSVTGGPALEVTLPVAAGFGYRLDGPLVPVTTHPSTPITDPAQPGTNRKEARS